MKSEAVISGIITVVGLLTLVVVLTIKGSPNYRSINAVSSDVSNKDDVNEQITNRNRVDSRYVKVLST
jgi:hypothetical protein